MTNTQKTGYFPSWVLIAGAVLMALPFGWGAGLLAAIIVTGGDYGQLPALTVPIGIVAAVIYAVAPVARPATRLKVLSAGTLVFLAIAWLTA